MRLLLRRITVHRFSQGRLNMDPRPFHKNHRELAHIVRRQQSKLTGNIADQAPVQTFEHSTNSRTRHTPSSHWLDAVIPSLYKVDYSEPGIVSSEATQGPAD